MANNYAVGTNYTTPDGTKTVIGGELEIASGGTVTNAGTQAALVADIIITYTTGDPSITPNGAVTVADGATPTVDELLELAEELIANQNAIIDVLVGAGLMAASSADNTMAQAPEERHYTLLATAARTATTTTSDQANTGLNINCRGVMVTLDVTAVTATPALTLSIQGKDPASGKYENLLTASSAVVTTGTHTYLMHPDAGTAAADVTQTTAFILPPVWRVSVAHGDTDSATYTVGVNLLP
jgi:hypothetical protein